MDIKGVTAGTDLGKSGEDEIGAETGGRGERLTEELKVPAAPAEIAGERNRAELALTSIVAEVNGSEEALRPMLEIRGKKPLQVTMNEMKRINAGETVRPGREELLDEVIKMAAEKGRELRREEIKCILENSVKPADGGRTLWVVLNTNHPMDRSSTITLTLDPSALPADVLSAFSQ